MLKKSLLIGGGLALLAALFFGRDAVSYISTSVAKVHQSVKDSVPIEFEIERARNMIKELTPEIRRNMHLIAKEEVEVERLQNQIERAEARLSKNRADLMRLKADLDSDRGTFVYAGHTYTKNQVTADLKSRFARYKTQDATLANLHKVTHARQRGLDAAREKLEQMLAAKRQLEVDVENLEARLKMVEVAQTTSDFNFDDSHLARTKDLINEIHTRIDVAEKMVNAEGYFHDEIPLDEEPETGNISEDIAEYFGGASPEEIASVLGDVAK
jgi:peptidoglycan hydrolase CwlO-like protein